MGTFIFWGALVLLLYVYLGYPLLLWAGSLLVRRGPKRGDVEPTVSIVIAAYNEEQDIASTVENKLSLDYPPHKLEVIVISDGSVDRTEEIVSGYAIRGVRLLRQTPRAGKTSALNVAVPEARGEIVCFSDANSMWSPGAIRALVSNFADPEVGYVTGRMVYVDERGSLVGDGCSSYMRYENQLRRWETELGSIVGVDGGVDAIRKPLYQPMRPDQLPDFVLPLRVVEQGFRVVYDEGAELRERPLGKGTDEYRMRVRVALRALWALQDMAHLLNPLRYGWFSVELLSHKVLRYTAFLPAIALYTASLLLCFRSDVYALFLVGQTVFYWLAWRGWRLEEADEPPGYTGFPYYFVLLNLASAHAFWRFVRREKQILWTPRLG